MHTIRYGVIIGTAMLLGFTGCKPETTELAENSPTAAPGENAPVPAVAAPQVHQTPPGNTSTSQQLPPGHPPVAEGSAKKAKSAGAQKTISGTVAEQIPAGKYLYLKLQTTTGDVWTAVLKQDVQNGDAVQVMQPHRMVNFASPTLKRTFDEIYFGVLGDGGNAPEKAAAPSSSSSRSPSALMKLADGPHSMHIEDVYRDRANLGGKVVRIRGMVVKYNPEILGANWIHIQDGSGDPKAANHDLVVTTAQTAAVGDDITIEGVVALDKDFGSGYSYSLMVERASITHHGQ